MSDLALRLVEQLRAELDCLRFDLVLAVKPAMRSADLEPKDRERIADVLRRHELVMDLRDLALLDL